jgi:hypothetical protein
VPAGDAGDVQQLLDQLLQAVGHPVHRLQPPAQLVGGDGLTRAGGHHQRIEVQPQRGERRLQLVRGDGDEVVAYPDGLFQLAFHMLALGDVHDDAAGAHHLPAHPYRVVAGDPVALLGAGRGDAVELGVGGGPPLEGAVEAALEGRGQGRRHLRHRAADVTGGRDPRLLGQGRVHPHVAQPAVHHRQPHRGGLEQRVQHGPRVLGGLADRRLGLQQLPQTRAVLGQDQQHQPGRRRRGDHADQHAQPGR